MVPCVRELQGDLIGNWSRGMPREILRVRSLKKHFPIRKGLLKRKIGDVKAVDGVSFGMSEKEILGLAGESGSGKTTIAMLVLRVYPPTDGQILYKDIDIAHMSREQRELVMREMQVVFQDPGSSLNPRITIGQSLDLPLKLHSKMSKRNRRTRAKDLLERVGLPPQQINRYPYALSGGQKQRVAIARALALNPSLVILDEPTSALDVSVQGKILELLLDLQGEYGLSYLLISHDLSLMSNIASRIAVMYLGKICEMANVDDLFDTPLHPYTRMLLSAIPVVSEAEERLKPEKIPSRGEIPDASQIPTGCGFHPRCPKALEQCIVKSPPLVETKPGHFVRCHLLNLTGRT